jgi:hypothetical protein
VHDSFCVLRCPGPGQDRAFRARRVRLCTGLEASMVDTIMLGVAVSQNDEDTGRETGAGVAPRYSRRLSDKILIAFHHACDQADFEVAEQLLHILEMMLTRRPLTPDGTRRRNMESLIAAHERLWHLRHPNSDEM